MSDADLDKLRKEYFVPFSVTFRKPKPGEVPSKPRIGEIVIQTSAFADGLRVLMVTIIKRFLQEAGIHPFQLALTGWQAVLRTYMVWMYVHGVAPTLKEYKVTFSLRPFNRPRLFYAYKFGTEVLLGSIVLRAYLRCGVS